MKTQVKKSESNETVTKIAFALVVLGVSAFAYFVVFVHGGNVN